MWSFHETKIIIIQSRLSTRFQNSPALERSHTRSTFLKCDLRLSKCFWNDYTPRSLSQKVIWPYQRILKRLYTQFAFLKGDLTLYFFQSLVWAQKLQPRNGRILFASKACTKCEINFQCRVCKKSAFDHDQRVDRGNEASCSDERGKKLSIHNLDVPRPCTGHRSSNNGTGQVSLWVDIVQENKETGCTLLPWNVIKEFRLNLIVGRLFSLNRKIHLKISAQRGEAL